MVPSTSPTGCPVACPRPARRTASTSTGYDPGPLADNLVLRAIAAARWPRAPNGAARSRLRRWPPGSTSGSRSRRGWRGARRMRRPPPTRRSRRGVYPRSREPGTRRSRASGRTCRSSSSAARPSSRGEGSGSRRSPGCATPIRLTTGRACSSSRRRCGISTPAAFRALDDGARWRAAPHAWPPPTSPTSCGKGLRVGDLLARASVLAGRERPRARGGGRGTGARAVQAGAAAPPRAPGRHFGLRSLPLGALSFARGGGRGRRDVRAAAATGDCPPAGTPVRRGGRILATPGRPAGPDGSHG